MSQLKASTVQHHGAVPLSRWLLNLDAVGMNGVRKCAIWLPSTAHHGVGVLVLLSVCSTGMHSTLVLCTHGVRLCMIAYMCIAGHCLLLARSYAVRTELNDL
jgi:hypothetical protein